MPAAELGTAARTAGLDFPRSAVRLSASLDGHQAPRVERQGLAQMAGRRDGIERQLRALVPAAGVILALCLGLAAVATLATWQARTT